jgi:prophage regulatory protein
MCVSRPCPSGAPAGDGIGLALLGSTSISTAVAATEMVFHVCRRMPAQGSIMQDVSRASLSLPTMSVNPPPPAAESTGLPLTGFVRARLLLRLIPFSRATLWRRVKAGSFPGPVRLSEGITAWRAEDIRRWIQECR